MTRLTPRSVLAQPSPCHGQDRLPLLTLHCLALPRVLTERGLFLYFEKAMNQSGCLDHRHRNVRAVKARVNVSLHKYLVKAVWGYG